MKMMIIVNEFDYLYAIKTSWWTYTCNVLRTFSKWTRAKCLQEIREPFIYCMFDVSLEYSANSQTKISCK